MKIRFYRIVSVLLLFLLCLPAAGCGEEESSAKLTDISTGMEKAAVEQLFGTEYESSESPARMTYTGLRLFDFVGKDRETKLVVFLNTEGKVYAAAYYLYGSPAGDHEKVKSYFTGLYGEPAAGENESEQWTSGEMTWSLNEQSDYTVIGVF